MDLQNSAAVDNLIKILLVATPSLAILSGIVFLFLRQLGKQSGNAASLATAINNLSANMTALITSTQKAAERADRVEDNFMPALDKIGQSQATISEVLKGMSNAQVKHDTQIDLIVQTQKIASDSQSNLVETQRIGNESLKTIARSNESIASQSATIVKLQEEGNLNLTTYTNDLSEAVTTQNKFLLENLTGQFASINANLNDQAQRTNEFIATIPDVTMKHDQFLELAAHLQQVIIGVDETKTTTNELKQIAQTNREMLLRLHTVITDLLAQVAIPSIVETQGGLP